MKYWLLTTEYPPFFGGGIGTYSAITSEMMQQEGHRVSVFVNDASVTDVKIDNRSDSLRIIRFNPSATRSSAFLGHVTNLSYEFAHIVKQFIEREGKPDVIESQEYLGIAYYLLQFKYLLYDWCKDIQVIITVHSPSFLYMEYNHVPEYKYPNFWICEMERFCLQAADLLIFPSQFILDELRRRFQLNNSSLAIIPNPFLVNEKYASNINSEAHNGEIVFYGKLTVQKGALYLLKYFQQLWDDGFSRPLYVLGGLDIVYHPQGRTMGDIIRSRYKKYIDKGLLKLEGKIDPGKMAQRLAKAEVVIIPSANDNLPYTVFEMMALGKILLVSKQGGQREVIENNEDGFIFDHEQAGSFSAQLQKILELRNDERSRISQNAVRKVMALFNPREIYKRKYREIEKLMSKDLRSSVFPFIRLGKNIPAETSVGENNKLLSVVVPYYNMGAYIDEAIQSIMGSDYGKKEILIINDGSTDPESIKKLDRYRGNNVVRVIDSKNYGLGHARNLGAEMATGEFLAFLDADDKVDPSYYSKAIKVFEQYPNVQFAGCWTKYFEHSDKTWPTFTPEPPIILYHNTVNTSALIYRRGAFLKHGRNDTKMTFPGLEDYDSLISMLASNCNGVILPEAMFHYRVRKDSMIRDISATKKILLHQHIASSHKQFYATFATEVFGLFNANGQGIFLDNPSLDYHLAEKMPFGGKLSRRLIYLVKKNDFTRKIAYKVYRLLNK